MLDKDWLKNTLAKCQKYGYRTIPVRNNKPLVVWKNTDVNVGDFAEYAKADMIGMILDDVVLVDYDGNKPAAKGQIMSVEELEERLDLDLIGMPRPFQVNADGDSIHWLFRLPDDIDISQLGNKVDKREFPFIDIQRGQTLVFLKSHKVSNVLPKGELEICPDVLIEAFKKDRESRKTDEHLDDDMGLMAAVELEEATSEEDIRDLLERLPNSKLDTYDDWLGVCASVHYATRGQDYGLEALNDWSKTAKTYDYKELVAKWESFTLSGGAKRGIGSLIREARSADIDTQSSAVDDMLLRIQDVKRESQLEVDIYPTIRKNEWGTIGAERLVAAIVQKCKDLGAKHITAKSVRKKILSRSVDYFAPLPLVTAEGMVLNHYENLKEICKRLGVAVRYNAISKEVELIVPNKGFTTDNRMNAAFEWLRSQCAIFGMPDRDLTSMVLYLAEENIYNPVATWIESKEWDGVERLPDLLGTVTVRGSEDLKAVLIKRWMLSAIEGVFKHSGVSAQGILVMQGDQGLGKTTWFKSLVPDELGLTKEGALLSISDKDSVKSVISHWLVELGELDSTFKRSDIAALKAFVTRDKDEMRLPYAKAHSQFARRTVFFASVNPMQFLQDDTGNRRYWTLAVTALDSQHGLDMQQIWAEVYNMWKAGERHFLTREEEALLNESNEEFKAIDPIEALVNERLNWEAPRSEWVYRTASEILSSFGKDNPSKMEATRVNTVMRALNGNDAHRFKNRRCVLCPPMQHGIEFDLV